MKLSSTYAESLVLAVKGRSLRRLAMFCVLLFGLSFYASGQTATIVGTVTDPSGSVIPNVGITITHTETGQTRSLKTNEAGQYVVPDLQIGHYNAKAQFSGFKVEEKKGIVLNVGDRTRIDFDMKVGTTQETVTVEADTVRVQTDTGEVSQVVTGEQVSQLASNGRSFYTFVNLTPGASSLQGNFSIPAPVNADANVSFNGNRPVHNIYLLDGGEDLDRGGGGTFSVLPSTDAVAEFRTLSSNYSSEYGLSSAATMTTVLKSGSNKFHASAWELFRNDALDANDWFRNHNPVKIKNPELRMNIFGFNVGGPVWKDKTFFFYNMEWRRFVQGQTLVQVVPSTSEYPNSSGDAVFPASTPIYAPNLPTTVLFRNCSTPPAGVTAGNQFPNNTIPACMVEPNSAALLKAGIFPANNSVSGGSPAFTGGNNVPSNIREEIVRIDHRFNDKFAVFGHFVDESILQTQGTTMWSGDNVPTVGNTFGNPSYSGVVHLIHTINPRLLNEVAFNYNGNRINILPLGTPALAAPSGFTFNRIFPGPNVDNRIPTINLSNQTGAQYSSNWTPWVNKADDYQIRDDISWTKGAHQLKFGASWALYKKVQDVFASTQGNFKFDGSFTTNNGAKGTGSDFADYLLGFAQQYQEDAIHDHGYWNNVSWAAYIQDNWRATQRLTLNLGLRWDGVPHTYEAKHRTSNFYPNLYNQAEVATLTSSGNNVCSGPTDPGCTAASPGLGTSPNPILAGLQFYLNGIGLDGLNGVPKGLVDNHWAAFGPRLGFAYDLTGHGKTVVRGGFGMMYERIQGNDMYNMGTNVPFSASVTANNVLLANPHSTTVGGTTALGAIPVSDVTGVSRSMYKLPVSYQYSFGVQQAIGANSVVSISYVGNQNRHQNYWTQVNLPAAGLLSCLTDKNQCTGAQPSYNQVLPLLGFHQIRLAENGGNAHYNSLQTSVQGRLRHDLDFHFGYTYSKAVDPTTGNGGNGYDLNNVSNPYVGWKYDLGPSPFDRTHVAFVSFVYDVPFLRNSPNHFLKTGVGGWQVSGTVIAQSGAPIDITDTNNSVTSIVPNSRNRPNLIGKISTPHKVDEWFDPSAFADPAPGAWGNLSHAALRGPGRQNWNLSLLKNFNFTERTRLEFRAESFNAFNHREFRGDIQGGGINTALGGSNFGAVTGAFDPRQLQLGLKLIF